MRDAGWIKLHRSISDHWLFTEYRPLTRQEAWIRILLTVNYEPAKTLIKGQLYECNPGQSILSLDSWAKEFVWSIQQVRTFFKLLESDGMIKTEGLQYTTRLTVCKWDIYQGIATNEQQTNNTPLTDDQQAANKPLTTIKEGKEGKERKEDIYLPQKNEEAFLLNEWAKSFFSETYIGKSSFETFDKLIRIDKYHPDEIKKAIQWARGDDFWSVNFLSPLKLRNKDKNGVKYIDVFLAKLLKNGTNRSSSKEGTSWDELAAIVQKHTGGKF